MQLRANASTEDHFTSKYKCLRFEEGAIVRSHLPDSTVLRLIVHRPHPLSTLVTIYRSSHVSCNMDIHAWLDKTEILPQVGCTHESSPGRHASREHTRRRGHAEPTWPSVEHQANANSVLASCGVEQKRRHRRASTTESSGSSSSSTTSSSQSDSTSSHQPIEETFERRKRHRTREDLYTPGSGLKRSRGRKKVAKAEGKSGSKKKDKSKHRRTKKTKKLAKPGLQMLQTFEAPNVGGGRLIVRS